MTAAEYIRKLAWSVAHEPDAAEALRACAALVEAVAVINVNDTMGRCQNARAKLAAIEALVPK